MRLSLLALAAALGVPALVAHADTISTFALTSTFNQGGGMITGPLVIDTTTGNIQSANLVAVGFQPGLNGGFNQVVEQNAYGPVYVILLSGTPADRFNLIVAGNSLVGYTGSGVCTGASTPCPSEYQTTYAAYYGAISGALTLVSSVTTAPPFPPLAPPIATTPEPSSFVLLGSGLLGAAGIVRRKHS